MWTSCVILALKLSDIWCFTYSILADVENTILRLFSTPVSEETKTKILHIKVNTKFYYKYFGLSRMGF